MDLGALPRPGSAGAEGVFDSSFRPADTTRATVRAAPATSTDTAATAVAHKG